MTTTADETSLGKVEGPTYPSTAADPRQKLMALIQWAASPNCPLELPPVLQGLTPIWLPIWLGKIENMSPDDLDRSAGHVLELAARVRDPNISVADFKAWLPRA
jgi:hypothetical protein